MKNIEAWKLIETVTESYESFLNPSPVPVTAQVKGKSVQFEIKATDIVCILSNERGKAIYLTKNIRCVDGNIIDTDKITVNKDEMTMDKLSSLLDSIKYHLYKVSRSSVVNLAYYNLNKTKLELELKDYRHIECKILSISPGLRGLFLEAQKQHNKLRDTRMKEREAYLKKKFHSKESPVRSK